MQKIKKITTAICLMGIMLITICSCSSSETSAEVLSVKNGYLTAYSDTITVGTAVDGFLSNPKWQYFTATDGSSVVECKGKCTYMGETVTVRLQFLINDDDTFEFYVLCIDDEEQNLLITEGFLEKIYEDAGAVAPTVAALSDTEESDTTSASTTDSDDDNLIDVKDLETYWLDMEYVTDSVLDTMTQQEVRTMLNALYAYHDYTFTTEYYQEYFSNMWWYLPSDKSMEECEAEFNEYETANKNTIVAYEQAKGWR